MPKRFDLDEWSNIGNVLLRQHKITRGQLDRLLDEQRRRQGQKLGELAIELKMVTTADVDEALHEQALHRLPPISADEMQAEQLLADAFAYLEHETDRFTSKKQPATTMMALPISPTTDGGS